MRFLAGLAVLMMLFGVGCTMQNSPDKKPQAQQQQSSSEKVIIDTELAGKAGETAKTVDAVEDSVAVVMDREISVAAKVTGFDRLRLKSIRKEVYGEIKKIAPGHKIHVTTDKKLFSELQKVDRQIQQGENPAELKAKFEKINKDMRG